MHHSFELGWYNFYEMQKEKNSTVFIIQYSRPLQAWMVMIFGFPISVSTSLRSATNSSVIQARLLFLSNRCPLSFPWQMIVKAKQLLSTWLSSFMIHFRTFRICYKIKYFFIVCKRNVELWFVALEMYVENARIWYILFCFYWLKWRV